MTELRTYWLTGTSAIFLTKAGTEAFPPSPRGGEVRCRIGSRQAGVAHEFTGPAAMLDVLEAHFRALGMGGPLTTRRVHELATFYLDTGAEPDPDDEEEPDPDDDS